MFLIILLFLWPFSAISLAEQDQEKRLGFLKNLGFPPIEGFPGAGGFTQGDKGWEWTLEEFLGTGGITLRMARFSTSQMGEPTVGGNKAPAESKGYSVTKSLKAHKGKRGSLVFINGWAENLLKYTELFYDLNHQGFSPIYTYDHRGQGFSDRLLEDPDISYVESYSHYEQDLRMFMDKVLQDPAVDKDRLFLIAHSMGGNIALQYLQKRKSPFRRVVLSAPMLKIQVTYSLAEFFLLNLIRGICLVSCSSPLPWTISFNKKERVTSSLNRIAFTKYIAQTWPKTTLKKVSYRWVVESFYATDSVMDQQKNQNIETPILILQADKEALVSNEYQDIFCLANPSFCQLKVIPGRHELFLETDPIRNQAVTEVVRFLTH